MSRICEAPDCQKPFEPTDPATAVTQKFCSIRCGTRARVARYRARHNGKQLSPPPGGPGGGLHPAYEGLGLSVTDGSLPVIGPKKPPVPTQPLQPQPKHTGAYQTPLFDFAELVA